MNEFLIGKRAIGLDQPPFVIAEMSGNHNQSIDRAMKIIDAAASAGAHAVKFQTYTADTMTLDLDKGEFLISDSTSLWAGRNLRALYEEAHTPWARHHRLFERVRAHGMIPFSTPFDETAVDFLEELGVACYKIASFENTDLPLISKAASTGKPLIISTGMATIAELDEAVRTAREAGCRDLVLLKCTSTYPATPSNTNVRTIPHLRELFNCEVGLSDHTMGCGAAVAAVALGATVIEKHFTVSRADGGVDSAFSMEPAEMQQLVIETDRAWQALGRVQYGVQSVAEGKSMTFRRSLYVTKDVAAGEVLSADNVRAIRPGFGLPPKFLPQVLGRHASRAIARGTALDWSLMS